MENINLLREIKHKLHDIFINQRVNAGVIAHGGSSGSDATAAKQDEQTQILGSIETTIEAIESKVATESKQDAQVVKLGDISNSIGAKSDTQATDSTSSWSVISLSKRIVSYLESVYMGITSLIVNIGTQSDTEASSDTGNASIISFFKRLLTRQTSIESKLPTLTAGRIPVDGSGVTQPVSIGSVVHVDDNGGSLTVDGTVAVSNFPATQAVSATSLPLPVGAATEANQTLEITALNLIATNTGANSTDFIQSGNINNGNAATGVSITGQGTYTTTIAITGTWVATLIIEAQAANSVWYQIPVYTITSTGLGTQINSITTNGLYGVVGGGYLNIRIRASVFTSGAAQVSLDSSLAQQSTYALPPSLTKGAQGALGYMVQNLNDAGRTMISLFATAAPPGLTTIETLITLTKSAGTAAVTTGTSFVITAGKKFRIVHFSVSTRGSAIASAQITTFTLRLSITGTLTTTSTALISTSSATSATALAWDRHSIPIPDGFEIDGDGTVRFGVSANAIYVTNAPLWYVNIIGYEY